MERQQEMEQKYGHRMVTSDKDDGNESCTSGTHSHKQLDDFTDKNNATDVLQVADPWQRFIAQRQVLPSEKWLGGFAHGKENVSTGGSCPANLKHFATNTEFQEGQWQEDKDNQHDKHLLLEEPDNCEGDLSPSPDYESKLRERIYTIEEKQVRAKARQEAAAAVQKHLRLKKSSSNDSAPILSVSSALPESGLVHPTEITSLSCPYECASTLIEGTPRSISNGVKEPDALRLLEQASNSESLRPEAFGEDSECLSPAITPNAAEIVQPEAETFPPEVAQTPGPAAPGADHNEVNIAASLNSNISVGISALEVAQTVQDERESVQRSLPSSVEEPCENDILPSTGGRNMIHQASDFPGHEEFVASENASDVLICLDPVADQVNTSFASGSQGSCSAPIADGLSNMQMLSDGCDQHALAKYYFAGDEWGDEYISLEPGDRVQYLGKEDSGWVLGWSFRLKKEGWYPSDYCGG